MTKFMQSEGKVYALMNARPNSHKRDVVVIKPLDASEEEAYLERKGHGAKDTEIFRHLFSKTRGARASDRGPIVEIDSSALNKNQLIKLFELLADGREMPSLQRMSRQDLETLLRVVHGRAGEPAKTGLTSVKARL